MLQKVQDESPSDSRSYDPDTDTVTVWVGTSRSVTEVWNRGTDLVILIDTRTREYVGCRIRNFFKLHMRQA